MDAKQREAILREILRQERFGRLIGTQCWVEGYCAALAARLDGEVSDYYVPNPGQGECHPQRCPLFFRNIECQRTMPLYIEGWGGWPRGRSTLARGPEVAVERRGHLRDLWQADRQPSRSILL